MASSLARHVLTRQLQRPVSSLVSTTFSTPQGPSRVVTSLSNTLSFPQRYFSTSGGDNNDINNKANTPATSSSSTSSPSASLLDTTTDEYNVDNIMSSFLDTSYFDPIERPDYTHMTNDDLKDVSTIPGWDLIHSPPKDKETIPRGALVGTVVSTKMSKTVNVAVDRYRVHRKYHKRLRYTKKFMAHDEAEVANTGDLVMIVPCQRISKHKHFMLREIIRAKGQL